MSTYHIRYDDGTKVAVSRIRQGQFRWVWFHGDDFHFATGLDSAKDYARVTGGAFVRESAPKTSRPVGLANLLSAR